MYEPYRWFVKSGIQRPDNILHHCDLHLIVSQGLHAQVVEAVVLSPAQVHLQRGVPEKVNCLKTVIDLASG